MVDVKKKIVKSYGTVNNFVDMMSIHFRAGMNVLPMLRKWDDSVDWRFGKGEPRGFFPGTVWLCHDEPTDRLFIRFHEGTAEKRPEERSVKITDIRVNSKPIIDIEAKEDRLKKYVKKFQNETL